MEEKIRVYRLIEYVGPRKAVEDIVKLSLHGTKSCGLNANSVSITGITLHEFPETISSNGVTSEAE